MRFDPHPLIAAAKVMRPEADDGELAVMLGVERRTIQRWRHQGVTLTLWDADRFAIHLGTHPLLVWPEWIDPSGQCGWCGEDLFINSGYCSRTHRRQAAAATPDGHAAAIAAKRRYNAKQSKAA